MNEIATTPTPDCLRDLLEEQRTTITRACQLSELVATGMAFTESSNLEIQPAQVRAFAEAMAILLRPSAPA